MSRHTMDSLDFANTMHLHEMLQQFPLRGKRQLNS
jgi:hypothetical protein